MIVYSSFNELLANHSVVRCPRFSDSFPQNRNGYRGLSFSDTGLYQLLGRKKVIGCWGRRERKDDLRFVDAVSMEV